MKRITIILAFAAIFIISARGQDFQNLNFESAQNLPGNPGNGLLVPVTNALPDWTAYDGSLPYANVLSEIYYVSNTLGNVSGSVELEGGSLALSGNWSVGLYLNSSISQTGAVPENAESLQFEAHGPGAGGSFGASGFAVMLGGQSLSYSALSEGPDYTVYGANIPADLDGQTETLTFLCQGTGSGNVLLDNIDFSTMSVPEPSEYAFLGLGAILFGLRHLRTRDASPSRDKNSFPKIGVVTNYDLCTSMLKSSRGGPPCPPRGLVRHSFSVGGSLGGGGLPTVALAKVGSLT